MFSVTLALHYQDIIVFNSIPMKLNESPCNAIKTKISFRKNLQFDKCLMQAAKLAEE